MATIYPVLPIMGTMRYFCPVDCGVYSVRNCLKLAQLCLPNRHSRENCCKTKTHQSTKGFEWTAELQIIPPPSSKTAFSQLWPVLPWRSPTCMVPGWLGEMRNEANGRGPTWQQVRTFTKIVSDWFENDSCPLALQQKNSQISDSSAWEGDKKRVQSQD